MSQTNDNDQGTGDTVVIVARHADRRDYQLQKESRNWCTDTIEGRHRPFDPPLAVNHGWEQGRKLGQHLAKLIMKEQQQQERNDSLQLPPLRAIYASPLLRCRKTAVAARQGFLEELNAKQPPSSLDDAASFFVDNHDTQGTPPLLGRVEMGLVESINEDWYRSWALPGADGTWGFRGKVDPATLHPLAKQPVQALLDWKQQHQQQQQSDMDDVGDNKVAQLAAAMDWNYVSKTRLDQPYTFHPKLVESVNDQRQRTLQAVNTVCEVNSTVLLISHGGPVTHLFEALTGYHWSEHGEPSFCCYSLYRRRRPCPRNDHGSDDLDSNTNSTLPSTTTMEWEAVIVNESSFLAHDLSPSSEPSTI